MSYKTIEILEQLKTLSALETTELVEDIKDTFNLHPAFSFTTCFPIPLIDYDYSAPFEFDVVLLSAPADKKISVLKAVRQITDLGLKEAKDFVESLPKTIKSGIIKPEAEDIKKQLEDAGASVSIR
ncbi:50S ribosomal protein L12P [Rivularia sp. IAM M-261]|nr:50S ribosomal protein L12P [Calothrix sp. PCC 7716]GJD17547.1 50S ribosomal protein L12P [Rivularia sp. IAM M-261]